ncbi:MAG TPA: choice-of-anchor D domain-containing protein [Ignavibacteria bacterium]|nr:choice-of-anchor D domain-containing protein [Ignavibacteria bacterium]
MKKLFLLTFLAIFGLGLNKVYSQTLVASYPFPASTPYNAMWGLTLKDDTLFVGSGNAQKIWKISKTGQFLDSFSVPFTYNQGLAWDGTGFWIASNVFSNGARLYKVNRFGVRMDSIYLPSHSQGIGGLYKEGNGLWYASYYPDFPTYPFTKAYKVDITTKQIVDSIPLRGKQVHSITMKGDTIIYVTDNFQADNERIYGYRKAVGDTVFSFPAPDPDNDCDPRGMAWDGQNLFLIAYRVGNNVGQYRSLYKYTLTGAGNPTIQTSSNTMNLGNVIVNQTGSQTLTINNIGTAKLIISNFAINNARFSILPSATPDTINPGTGKDYSVRFSPLAFGNDSATLNISSNDGGVPVKTVKLYGKGVQNGSFISLSTSSYDYAQRRVHCLTGYTFDITNQGSAPLSISSVNLSSSYYMFDTVGLTFPVVIDTQRTRSFRVWFRPNNFSLVGLQVKDSLRINSNAVNLPQAKLQLSGTVSDTNSAVGYQWWEGVVPNNPFTSIQDKSANSMKQINDVNGDGVNDFILSAGNYLTLCYNGNASVTADILWSFNSGIDDNNTGAVPYDDAMQIRTDIDGDGIQDVVIGCAGGNEMVYTLSGRTGRQIWAYGDSLGFSDGDINAVDVLKDYNNDGINDVVVSASGTGASPPGRHSVFCLNGLNGNVLFQYVLGTNFQYGVISSPTGGAVANNNSGGPYYINGFNNSGSATWQTPVTGNIYSLKLLPDVDGDGNPEIFGLADSTINLFGVLFCINSSNGGVLWRKNYGQKVYGQVIPFTGEPNLLLAGPKTFYKIDYRGGDVVWSNPVDNTYILGAAILGKIFTAAGTDVAAATLGNKVFVMNESGVTQWTYEFGSGNTDFAAERVIGLKNINFNLGQVNNSDEILAQCRDGRIKCFSGGNHVEVNIQNTGTGVPEKYELQQNYPNPFNPVTTIKFGIPKAEMVKLKIYDMLGREIQTLVNENLNAGNYEFKFDASAVSSGIYFYKLEAGSFSSVRRMVLVK